MITPSELRDITDEASATMRAALTYSPPGELLFDGTQFSPADRKLPHGEFVYQNGSEEQWDMFIDAMQDVYKEEAYWEEGILWKNEAEREVI